jgi:hypothetical protein
VSRCGCARESRRASGIICCPAASSACPVRSRSLAVPCIQLPRCFCPRSVQQCLPASATHSPRTSRPGLPSLLPPPPLPPRPDPPYVSPTRSTHRRHALELRRPLRARLPRPASSRTCIALALALTCCHAVKRPDSPPHLASWRPQLATLRDTYSLTAFRLGAAHSPLAHGSTLTACSPLSALLLCPYSPPRRVLS